MLKSIPAAATFGTINNKMFCHKLSLWSNLISPVEGALLLTCYLTSALKMWLCNVFAVRSQYEPEEGASWSIMIPLYSHGIAWHMVNKVMYCHIPIYFLKLTCMRFQKWKHHWESKGYCKRDISPCGWASHDAVLYCNETCPESYNGKGHFHTGKKQQTV